MDDERCPSCGSVFPADRAWANRTSALRVLYPAFADLNTRVRCPNCGTVFDATQFRFFGFVPPRVMKIGVVLFISIMLIAAVYFVFVDAP